MNKESLKIVIVLVCFAATGVILYFVFFKNSGSNEAPASIQTEGLSDEILPHGDELNFGVIYRRRFDYNTVNYPKLNPFTEVGKDEENLITPLNPGQ